VHFFLDVEKVISKIIICFSCVLLHVGVGKGVVMGVIRKTQAHLHSDLLYGQRPEDAVHEKNVQPRLEPSGDPAFSELWGVFNTPPPKNEEDPND